MICTCPHQDVGEPFHDRSCPVTQAKPTQERIVAAAIHHVGITFSVPAPKRHHDVCHLMYGLGLPIEAQRNQGFLTSHGRFVNREEAVTVAKAAGQISIPKRTQPDYELFSEDLW